MTSAIVEPTPASTAARQRMIESEGGAFLLNDWVSALFIHYEVDPDVLQSTIGYQLDLYDGRAYVSVVAFTMRRLRLRVGGRIVSWITAPIADHGFLNVRTYVTHEGEPGIHFMAEWLTNRLSVMLGPKTFGLPYRYGRLDYRHDEQSGDLSGRAQGTGRDQGRTFAYRGQLQTFEQEQTAAEGTLRHFLIERYTAYTLQRTTHRRFRVWHEPWRYRGVQLNIECETLLAVTGSWSRDARYVGADFSRGVEDVWMGRPRCINGSACERV